MKRLHDHATESAPAAEPPTAGDEMTYAWPEFDLAELDPANDRRRA